MTYTVSTTVQASAHRDMGKEPSPAQAQSPAGRAEESGETRFPYLFKSVRDDADPHKPARDASPAGQPDSHAMADEEKEEGAVLTDAAMLAVPSAFALPVMAFAIPVGVQPAAPEPAATNGALLPLPAPGKQTADLPMPVAMPSVSGTSVRVDADPTLKFPMPQNGVDTGDSGSRAAPSAKTINAGTAQLSAPESRGAISVNMQLRRADSGSVKQSADDRAVSPVPDTVRNVKASDTGAEPATSDSQFRNYGVTPELAQVQIGTVATNDVSQPALKLAGSPSQWQQPLRDALGDRLQIQLARNSEHAVIRLDPPNLGRIEISIRHEAGALQVHMSASDNEVLRQLTSIGDGLRQDLIHRQYNEVAVVVSSAARGDADSTGRQRHADPEREDNAPGRALHEADQGMPSFTFLSDSE